MRYNDHYKDKKRKSSLWRVRIRKHRLRVRPYRGNEPTSWEAAQDVLYRASFKFAISHAQFFDALRGEGRAGPSFFKDYYVSTSGFYYRGEWLKYHIPNCDWDYKKGNDYSLEVLEYVEGPFTYVGETADIQEGFSHYLSLAKDESIRKYIFERTVNLHVAITELKRAIFNAKRNKRGGLDQDSRRVCKRSATGDYYDLLCKQYRKELRSIYRVDESGDCEGTLVD